MQRLMMIPLAALAFTAVAAASPEAVDGLAKVKSPRLDTAYVLPGADFRPYRAVLLDPVEVAFDKNWLRNYNSGSRDISRRISEDDAKALQDEVRTGFARAFAKTFTKAGYKIVTAPGPGVLRVHAAVTDIQVNAPDTMSAGRTRSYATEAGSAKLVLEARDSSSGKLLGRAIDNRTIGDQNGLTFTVRNSVTNRADFERAFETWSKAGVKALDALKASSTQPATR